MPYRVEIAPRAAKQLRALSRQAQQRITAALEKLQDDPRPSGYRQLSGGEGFYRIRVGDYRVIYTIEDDILLVLIVKVGVRGDIYR
jgi:mRNA interferase RelE/StbE